MNYKKHLLVGFVVSIPFMLVMNKYFGWFQITSKLLLLTTVIILIGSLFPDLDHPMAKLNRYAMFIGLLMALLGVLSKYLSKFGFSTAIDMNQAITFGVILAFVVFSISFFGKHRGFTHTVWFCFVYGIIIYVVTNDNLQLGTLGVVSCYSHLIADKQPLKIW